MLGEPETQEVKTLGGSPPGPQASRELVAPVDYSFLSFLEENIVVIDFGQSFDIKAPPKGYEARTIRAGSPLFSTYFGSHSGVMRGNVLTLGKLPEPWWSAFEKHHKWFEENGEPKFRPKSSIREKLEMIGAKDTPPVADNGPMIEAVGTRPEVMLLSDLLEKMLKYCPEERITIQEVVQHPWFKYTSVQ
ncbi:hypothetical protein AX14_011350 [Amanita brunnescens Koide BX004]|nr:hypothetical protein AX14_011350 [Amanita brunnescens Koide BX004]